MVGKGYGVGYRRGSVRSGNRMVGVGYGRGKVG